MSKTKEYNEGPMHYDYQYEIQPIQTLTKYFDDGYVEMWLTNDDGDELYLIKSWVHPNNKSPIVRQPAALLRQDGHQQAEGTPAKGEGENTSEQT